MEEAMRIRNAEDVIKVATDRGFKFWLKPGPPPMPMISGDGTQATPALMEALKAWRVEIIEIIAKDEDAHS